MPSAAAYERVAPPLPAGDQSRLAYAEAAPQPILSCEIRLTCFCEQRSGPGIAGSSL